MGVQREWGLSAKPEATTPPTGRGTITGALHAQAVAAAWWHQASRRLDGLLRTTAFLTTPADGSVFDAGNHLQHDV